MIQNLLFSKPELSHCEDEKSAVPIFVTVQGRCGIVFKTRIVDLESSGRENDFCGYEEIVNNLPFGVVARLKLIDEPSFQYPSDQESRVETINAEGFRNKKVLVSLEWNKDRDIDKSDLPIAQLSKLGTSLTAGELTDLFNDKLNEISQNDQIIDQGGSVKGVYRIYKPGNDAIDWTTLPSLLCQIPHGYELTVTISKTPADKSETKLRRKITKDKMNGDAIAVEKVAATEEALRAISLYGNSLFEIEWLISLDRDNEASLRSDLSEIKSKFSKFGDGSIETFGAYRSFVATLHGSNQHVTFKEISPTVMYYLPITCFGESSGIQYSNKRTLLIHRDDLSVHQFDLFQPSFNAFNMVISGTTGSGKSVFGNALSRSLLNDPSIHMIKVDVGGSYKRECALYGGKEISFNLNEPSGVDPFLLVNTENNKNDSASILVEFLCNLALEEGERFVLKDMRSHYEEAVKEFIGKSPGAPFNQFIETYPELPRIRLLKRWGKGGIFENVLISRVSDNIDNRYVYYNFESVQNAADSDYTSGVMAAVIAKVNIEMIRLSTKESRDQKKRLVFFCDETKFFIEKNASFFLLTTANFRKFGHSIILVLQDLSTFVLNKNGQEDLGLLINSPIKVFYPKCASEAFLRSTMNLTERELDVILKPPPPSIVKVNYRDFILQDDRGTRKLRLSVTPEEYFSMTSSRDEVDRINQIEAALPKLKTEDIIKLIVLNGGLDA